MTDDELSALRWIHKGDTRERAVGIAPGLAALIRLLEGLAPSLEPGYPPGSLDPGYSQGLGECAPAGRRFRNEVDARTQRRRGRGRPPTQKGVENALESVELADRIAEGKAAGEKQEALIARERGSRSKKFSQIQVVHRVRERK